MEDNMEEMAMDMKEQKKKSMMMLIAAIIVSLFIGLLVGFYVGRARASGMLCEELKQKLAKAWIASDLNMPVDQVLKAIYGTGACD